MSATTELVRRRLVGKRLDVTGRAFEVGLLLTLVVSLTILLVLLGGVLGRGAGVLADRGWGFLTSGNSTIADRAGVGQAVTGSVMLMLFVIAIAFPLGIGAAVYIEEYARDTRLNRVLAANIRNLAGVPSVVYGILGLIIFVKAVGTGPTVISGGLTLAALVLPIVIITAGEALRAVPQGIREAGYGVGATRWEVIRSHVLPYAAPGILTGTVLTLARAFGETAPLLLVGAVRGFFANPGTFWDKLNGPYTSLPTIIFDWSSRPQAEFQELAAAAIIVLLAVLLLVNGTAIILRNRYERRW